MTVYLSLWICPKDTVTFTASRGFYGVIIIDPITEKECLEIIKAIPDNLWEELKKQGLTLKEIWHRTKNHHSSTQIIADFEHAIYQFDKVAEEVKKELSEIQQRYLREKNILDQLAKDP